MVSPSIARNLLDDPSSVEIGSVRIIDMAIPVLVLRVALGRVLVCHLVQEVIERYQRVPVVDVLAHRLRGIRVTMAVDIHKDTWARVWVGIRARATWSYGSPLLQIQTCPRFTSALTL